MAEQAHSIIGASSYHRWKVCPGSVRLSRDLPPRTSEAAKEGTLAHEIAQKILEGKEVDRATVNEEMWQAVRVYCDVIGADASGRMVLGIERPLNLHDIHPGLFGTTDAYSFHGEKLLRVYDFKYGKSPVHVEENEQLLYYALGVLLDIHYPVEEVELVIVQPRAPRYGQTAFRWRFPMWPTMVDFSMQLEADAKRTEDSNAELSDGKHCFFCPANLFCPKLLELRNQKAAELFLSAEN